jgi:hypothetical protein
MLQADSKPCDRVGSARHPASADTPDEQGRGCGVGQAEVSAEGTIDLAHLARMTCGEKSLEAQVLRLFDRQAGMLLARMQQSSPKAEVPSPTPLQARRGIGAWEVAAAAEGLEFAERGCDATGFAEAHCRLAGSIRQAPAAIMALLAVS